MKTFSRRGLFSLMFMLVLFSNAGAKEVPYLSSRVNDYAGILSPECIHRLEGILKAHEDSTSNQVVVLTIPSLEGEVLEEYSIKVVEQWKLGTAKNDNGVLLLIANDEHKVRIEVGNGLEGALTDMISGSIIRHQIVPFFKEGQYDAGVEGGIDAILKAIRFEYQVEAESSENYDQAMTWPFALLVSGIFLLVVGTFTTIALLSQGAGSWFLYAFLTPFWLAFPTAVYGAYVGLGIYGFYAVGFLVAKYLFSHSDRGKQFFKKYSKNFNTSGRGGGIWGSTSGSSWSSSSSGSSSSFSGGGGSFSGGGSSGSW